MLQEGHLISAASELAATLLAKHVLPLGIKSDSKDFPWHETKRATFTLLQLAKRNVFITCSHVLSALHEIQAQNASAQLVAYLTSATCLVELDGFTIVDNDSHSLDVAIFRSAEDNIALPGMRFIEYASSYLPDPTPGEPVSIVGYPGKNVAISKANADFGFMHICFRASSVSARQIILANEHGDRDFFDYDDPTRLGVGLGGLSGSPAFVVRAQRYRFVGIVTECSDKDQTIIISRLGCLNPDGTLDHNAIPW